MTILARRIIGAVTAPLEIRLEFLLIWTGVAQWVLAVTTESQDNSATWGVLATMLPMEIWAIFMVAGSLMTWLGMLYPPHRGMVAVGSTIQVMHFTALGLSAAGWTGWSGMSFSVLYAGNYVVTVFAVVLSILHVPLIAQGLGHGYER
jgi:hypothetical protein